MQQHRYGNRLAACFGNTGQVVTLTEISDLAAGGESETVEFKKSTGQRGEAARTLSAMLNGAGGTVLFGVTDSGAICGQEVSDKTLLDITQACMEINPTVPPSIERVDLGDSAGREVLVVSVPAGTAKPYSYRGRHYVRSGAATVKMADETEVALVLERVHSLSRWETAESGQGIGSLDIDEIAAFRDDAIATGRAQFERDAPVEVVLRSMGLLDDAGAPNRGAVALFGRPESLVRDYPMVGAQLVAVSGVDLAQEFVDEERVDGNVFGSLGRAMRFCEEHLRHPTKIEGTQAQRWLEIPELVIREALANAFAHRDYAIAGRVQVRVYSDRVEIVSPGVLHFGVTTADLYVEHSSHAWNPLILGCLYRRGIVEELGSGTLRMIRECAAVRSRGPVFTVDASALTCSIPRAGYWLDPHGHSVDVTDSESAALGLLFDAPMRRGELAAALDMNDSTTRELLVRLREAGLVHSTGRGRGAAWAIGEG